MIKKCGCSRLKQSRYFKEGETEVPEGEFRRRKRAYFRNRLFYNRLCDLVTRIDEFKDTTVQTALQKEKTGLEFSYLE